MNLPPNPFLKAIKSGAPQIGLWTSLGGNISAQVLAHAGFDWICVDMEHSPNELRDVLAQLQVFAGSETTAVVRPPSQDSVMVKRLMDIGAHGLIFPMVETPDEARAMVAAASYPPKGIRGVAGSNRANAFGRYVDYFDRVEDETAIIVQIESVDALARAVEIGEIDGVDGVFFGPADIGADMGILGKPADPAIWDAVRPVAKALIDKGIAVGTLVSDLEFAKTLIGEGYSFIACGVDTAVLARGADAIVSTMKGE